MDSDHLLGKILKQGTINAQDDSGEWVSCHVTVMEKGLGLGFHTQEKRLGSNGDDDDYHYHGSNGDDDGYHYHETTMEFASYEDVVIDMLPDHARRSRESKLFPFAVKHVCEREKDSANRKEIILATSNGREMWEWATAIQWLGTKPVEEKIPLFIEPEATWDHNPHYENPNALQKTLLHMFTYKNLPEGPVRLADIAKTDREGEFNIFRTFAIQYPTNFMNYHDMEDEDNVNDFTPRFFFNESDNEENKDNADNKTPSKVENHEHIFGLFAYIVLVGSCVQVNEKCFELILSSDLYDISSQVPWKGNSIFSMLCEGNFCDSRKYMTQALFKKGYPSLEGYYAGHSRSMTFSILLAKPTSLWIPNPTGQPVHLEDQKLCRVLRDDGDGKEANMELSEQLLDACEKMETVFESEHNCRITSLDIPQRALDWGYSYLTKLNLSNNGIFELPDELYDFTSLQHLNLSRNCLFGLSHKLGNLTNLDKFDIQTNLISELPDSIEQLENIDSFHCSQNPIRKPPSNVWELGIGAIRKYFKDMRESGVEVNVDLKVLVLGQSESGKTSLINALINPQCKALTRVGDRTVGIEKRTWEMERGTDEQPINFLIHDFAGQREYYLTHHLFLGSRALYILAFDLSIYEKHDDKDEALASQVLFWWNSIQDRVCDTKSNGSKTPKILIVATHADMVNDAEKVANHVHESMERYIQLQSTGVKDEIESLEEELLDLDPRKSADANDKNDIQIKEAEYQALSTHKKVQIMSKANKVRKLRHQRDCSIALPSKIYPISSKDMSNFDNFREQIASTLTEIGPSGKYFPQIDEQLPRSWFQIRKFVRDQSTRKGRECMKLPQYFKLLSDELGITEDVGRRATKFCHDLGDVLFFDKEGIVFLRPSFLIDVFKLLIRHDHKESTYWTEEIRTKHSICEDQFNKGKEMLLKKGELKEWLLDILWSKLDDDIGPESGMKNNLIHLLETFDIATSIEFENERHLLIPEFQPKSLKIQWSPKNNGEGQFEMQRWICVNRKLPHGLLKRFQVRIMKKIFKRSGTLSFNLSQNQIHIVDLKSTILYCASGKGNADCPSSDLSEGIRLYLCGDDEHKEHMKSLLFKLENCLKDTLGDYPGLNFDHYIVYQNPYNKKGGLSYIKLEEVKAKRDAGESTLAKGLLQIDDLLPILPQKVVGTLPLGSRYD